MAPGASPTNTVSNITFFIAIVSLLAWAAWALVTFEIGGRLMPEPQTRVDVGELLRTIGFASTPGMLRALGAFPRATTPVFVITSVWMLLAMIVAVRQALDYRSTPRAVAVCVLGWVLALTLPSGSDWCSGLRSLKKFQLRFQVSG